MLWRGKLAGLRFGSSWQLPIALTIWLGVSGDLSTGHRRDKDAGHIARGKQRG